VAFVAAEPTRADTLERFAAKFEPHGFRREAFYHCYGLAESTLISLGGLKREAPIGRRFAGAALDAGTATPADAGRPLGSACRIALGERVEIVDPESHARCAPGRVGEIWVQGPSVARGYWGKPEATLETFGAYTGDGQGPFLRTGDLGFVAGGELFIAGRLK